MISRAGRLSDCKICGRCRQAKGSGVECFNKQANESQNSQTGECIGMWLGRRKKGDKKGRNKKGATPPIPLWLEIFEMGTRRGRVNRPADSKEETTKGRVHRSSSGSEGEDARGSKRSTNGNGGEDMWSQEGRSRRQMAT